jgi:hypothetical protein
MQSDAPILDWQLNEDEPEAVSWLAQALVAELITTASPDPIYRQLDINYPKWQVYGPQPDGTSWALLEHDYLYHPSVGTLIPAAMAWLRSEKLIVYNFKLICIVQPDDSFTVGRIV